MATAGTDKPSDGREEDAAAADRRKALKDTAGALTGVYSPGYLEQLRADWPD